MPSAVYLRMAATPTSAVIKTMDNSKLQTNLKTLQTDSTKIMRSVIENVNYLGSINMEFDLLKEVPDLIAKNSDGKGGDFLYQLLNHSRKVKIHVEHAQQNSNSQLLTQQNNTKSLTDATVNKQIAYKQEQRTNIQEKTDAIAETKPSTIIYCLIATSIILGIYILSKLNIPTLLLRFFRINN